MNPIPHRLALVFRTLLVFAGWFYYPASADAGERNLSLTVQVKDSAGKPIPVAHVIVYYERIRGSTLLVRPPDRADNTNANGIVRFEDLKVSDTDPVTLSIEASAENFVGAKEDLPLGTNFSARVLKQFFLEPKGAEKAEDSTSVKVSVHRKGKAKDEDLGPIEGASVLVEAIGLQGRATGQTNASGDATVVLSRSTAYDVTASKELFGSAKQRVTSKEPKAELGPVTLFLQRERGTELTVTVTDDSNGSSIGDATVVLDGPDYLRGTTSGGTARFTVTEPGTYNVRIWQQYYEELKDQITVAATEEKKAEPFQLAPKGKKEENKDKIEVTVLAREDKESKAKPLRGAEVKVGRYTMATDENGRVTQTGSYDLRQEVEVKAQGYKPQTKTVGLGKALRYSAGEGSVTFTLEPLLSETDPVRIIVEVRDPSGSPVPTAGVGFRLPDGTRLGGGLANANGEVEFPAKGTPATDPTVLRKGIEVHVEQPGYNEHTSLIDSSLLLPSTQPRRYSVQLDKDWTDLIKALGKIEGRVGALRNEIRSQITKGQSVKLLAAKAIAARGRVEAWLNELKAARRAFDTKLSGTKCEQAKELMKSIEALQKEAGEKETALRKLLDEASGIAANCKTKAEGAVAMEKYRNAAKLAAEMRSLGPKASLANDKLKRFAEAMKDAGPLQTKLQETATSIQNELETTKKDSAAATSDFNDAYSTHLNFPGKRAVLVSDYEKLKANDKLTKNYEKLPKDLAARLERLDQVLGEGGADMSLTPGGAPDLTRVDEVITPALAQIEKSKGEADTLVAELKAAMCTVQPMDAVVEQLGALDTGNTVELAAVADLPGRAQACGASASPTPTPKATATPTPTPTVTPSPTPTPSPSPSPADELVSVPAVIGAESIEYARIILNQAGLKSAFKARKPPSKKEELTVADSAPGAGEKVKRGSTVVVYVYQKYEAETPTPTATPTPAKLGNMPTLTGLTLDQAVTRLPANMRIGSDEVGDAPPSPGLALTIFYQNPAAGSSVDLSRPTVVTVKRYGSAQATLATAVRFDGTYVGSYRGADKGAVRFTVSGGTISIQSPGSGSGQVTASGSARISGAGNDGNSSYSFTGTFSVTPDGKATASGSWTGQQSGFKGSGTWSAARP